jgi:hypothetical protein
MQGKARQGKARQGKARQGKARQGKARQGKARQGKARQGNLSSSMRHAVLAAPRGDTSDAEAQASARGREEGPSDSR